MSQPSFESIKTAISESAISAVVPNHSFRDFEDLLLLDWRSDIAAFALVGEKAKPSYEKAYLHFKSLYRDNKNAWDKRSLSFVLCRLDDSVERDSFFSLVESDPYFCRKYVIRYSEDPETLVREIGRLPFLPLPRVGGESFVRAPSAKQVLHSLDFPSDFSRALVESGKRSAKTLAEDIKRDALSLHSFSTTDIGPLGKLAPVESTRRTRVKSLKVEAFRAYRNSKTFDLSAPITVLYGQNGLGKTSLFDAIDFACTGKIGRLFRHDQRSPEEFARLATHLDCDPSEAHVRIELARTAGDGESIEWAQRSVTDWNYARIEEVRYDRRKFLKHLTGVSAEEGETNLSVIQLEALFRATHLFGQDDQELLLQFRQKSMIPNDLFSRMLALDDYTEAINKTSDLEKELKKWSQATANKAKECQKALSEAELRQNELQARLSASDASGTLSDLWKEIRTLAASIGMSTPDEAPALQAARVLVSIGEKERESLIERRTALAEVIRDLNAIGSEMAAEKADAAELERIRKQIEEVSELQRMIRQEHEASQGLLESKQKELTSTASILESIAQCRKLDVEKAKFEARLAEVEKQVASAEQVLKASQESAKAKAASAQELIMYITECQKRLRVLQEKMKVDSEGLTQLRERVGLQSREKEISQKLKDDAAVFELSKAEQNSLQEQHEKLAEEVAELSARYQGATAQEKELSKLLDSLQRFVSNCECPACGAAFSSNDSVIAAIGERKGKRSEEINILSESLNDARTKLEGTAARLKRHEGENAKREKDARELQRQLDDTAARRRAIESDLLKHGSIDGFDNAEAVLNGEIDAAKLQEVELEKELDSQARKRSKLETEQANDRSKIEEQESELDQNRITRNELRATLEECTSAIAREASSLVQCEGDQLNLDELESVQKQRRELLMGEVKRIRDLITSQAIELNILGERERNSREMQEPLNLRMKERDRLFSNVRGLCTKIRIEYPPTEAKSQETDYKLAASESLVDALIVKLNSLIAALEIAELRQALNKVQKDVDALRDELKTLEQEQRKSSANRKGAEKLQAILSDYRKTAFADHIKTYGPLISVLQQRLRSVFGFSNVSLEAIEEGVLVQVGWRDQRVKPIDYFSDSQKQILALSVFLGSCLRQNWSGFTPILLDDPITHCDDFNAHAFVELLRGLTATEPDRWQFVISTCEERLYSLMRRKFTDAKFYRFIGMQQEGPMVEIE